MIPLQRPAVTVDIATKTIENGEVSVILNFFSPEISLYGSIGTFIKKMLQDVSGAELVHIGSGWDRLLDEPAQRFQLTVTGDPIRATGVQNVIKAMLEDDEVQRTRYLRAVNRT